jgi:hypothetical protein
MKLSSIAALIALVLFLFASCASDQQVRQEQEEVGPEPVVQPIVVDSRGEEPSVVVTTHVLIQQTGCWANLFDEANFQGRKLTIYNGIDLPSLEFTGTKSWRGRVESIELGPNARITLFGGENYLMGHVSPPRGTSLSDLQQSGLEQVESLRLECSLQ